MRNPREGRGMFGGPGADDDRDMLEFVVASVLDQVEFPAPRQELVERAQLLNAPEAVVTLFSGLENRDYASPEDVADSAGLTH